MKQTQVNDVFTLLDLALREDIGAGDLTTEACVSAGRKASGRYIARQRAVVAGIELIDSIYKLRGGVDSYEVKVSSGDVAEPGDLIAEVQGPARTLLECERVSLNLLQRLSGIATLTRQYVLAIEDTGCRLLDTRKTTPGLRRLEKMATSAGGAVNHRMGLYDAVLIKNNHITAAGGVRAALERTRNAGVPVEIEVRTREELDEALACGATHLLLDNLSPEEAKEWIAHINRRATVELSGRITLETARAYAESGADFLSSGTITHSARAVDINFRIEPD